MSEKPRVRVPWATSDSFQNFAARLGIGTDNINSYSDYGFNPITRNRIKLEWMYRGSWIVRTGIDTIAEDMTRAGIEFHSDSIRPDDVEKIQRTLSTLRIMPALSDAIRWARLYGGAIAVMLIDGHDLATPLNPERIDKGSFRGLAVLDRWMLQPDLFDLIADFGPEMGFPKIYKVIAGFSPLRAGNIHYSRVLRFDGDRLPYWQMLTENGWGASIIEAIFDRLVGFDSTTTGIGQLVYKSYLRTLKLKDYRQAVAAGGKALEGITAQMTMIRTMQSTEGLTVIDAEDELETASYTFAGLSDVLLQFGQQLSGALQIPLVRLFGQSPAGLNATGEGDLRTYYDGIRQRQESDMRLGFEKLLRVVHASTLGRLPDTKFNFDFAPLFEMSDADRVDVADKVTSSVTGAFESGLITQKTALQELRQSSRMTNMWTNITDDDIESADIDPPSPEPEMASGEGPSSGEEKNDRPPAKADEL